MEDKAMPKQTVAARVAKWGGMAYIKVICQECGRKFSTKSLLPTCPKCGGSDVELR